MADVFHDPRQQRGIDTLDRLAEEGVLPADCRGITAELRRAIPPSNHVVATLLAYDQHFLGLMLYREFCSRSIAVHAVQATAGLSGGWVEQREQANLLRCIVGNPFRPIAFDPAWLTSTVRTLAEGVYYRRASAPLPVLADALQDAGCEQPDILDHLRGPGPHVRGCWVVDLILGKT